MNSTNINNDASVLIDFNAVIPAVVTLVLLGLKIKKLVYSYLGKNEKDNQHLVQELTLIREALEKK